MNTIFGRIITAGQVLRGSALLLGMLASSITSPAQTVTLFGSLANFDVLNDTGQDTHGFQIELYGLPIQAVPYAFPATRYGGAKITPFAGGVLVRLASSWNAASQQFVIATTVPATFAPTFGHSCVGTAIVGCDHYGVTTYGSPTSVVYRWLVADATNPGALIPYVGPAVAIPHPTVTVVPPAQVGAPPNIVFQVQEPPPPPPPAPKPVPQFGDAKWVKVYKTEVPNEVALDDLLAGNVVVPEDPALVETAWKLLQFNPHSANSGVLTNQGGLGSGSHAVVRRYEFYKYAGVYDPLDHSAKCGGDGTCNAPVGAELGDFIGAQNAAANVGVPSITVAKVGSGTVTGANGKINCGGSCSTTVSLGTVVTLTAIPPSNAVFSGWSGACGGAQLTCTVTVNDALTATATFTQIFTLSIGRGGSGTVTGTPAGVNSTQINCGSSCSAKFMQGTIVTLAATPAPGLSFVNWTGACSGTAPTCDVAISKDTQAQANFK